MDRTDFFILLTCIAITAGATYLGLRAPMGVTRAIELCTSTGGSVRVVEYNAIGGITLNCVYPSDTPEFLENLSA